VRKAARGTGIGKAVTPHTLGHVFITAVDAGVPLRDVQEAASHADPRTTMRFDRARGCLERHATHIVAGYVAGAARVTGVLARSCPQPANANHHPAVTAPRPQRKRES
jgi:integrase/recombinase XerD